jgi:hypothetical protein
MVDWVRTCTVSPPAATPKSRASHGIERKRESVHLFGIKYADQIANISLPEVVRADRA